MSALEILKTGWITTLQDRGRFGFGSLGVPAAGALDPDMAGLVNRLVGNPEGMVVVETTPGLELRANRDVVVASSLGAEVVSLGPGEHYAVGNRSDRTFVYLAIRGGIQVDPVLDSCSHDTLTGIGPLSLQVGSLLELGDDPGTPILLDTAPVPTLPGTIRLWPGPHLALFDSTSVEALLGAVWEPSPSFNRVAMRLDGPPLVRRASGEIASFGLVPGAIQVPHDQRPVVMLRDHPVTGGYPVIAVVEEADLYAVAQRPPGSSFRFAWANAENP
jgi:biotin-dependent carboxylase-like uncharacterized protein